jgi:hypothetical protein
MEIKSHTKINLKSSKKQKIIKTKNLCLHTSSLNSAKDKTLTWLIKPADFFIMYIRNQHLVD